MRHKHMFVTIGCILIGISAGDNLQCRIIDFNKLNSLSVFEQCSTVSDFIIKTYEDNPSVPVYNGDDLNEIFLSNTLEGWSCFSSLEQFIFEADNSEVSIAIFLQSDVIEDTSHVLIEVVDLNDGGSVVTVIDEVATFDSEWYTYTYRFRRNFENAKITLRAFVTVDATLAIQNLHILHSGVDESECVIEPETPAPPTTEPPTTEPPTTEPPTTEPPTTEPPTTEPPTTEPPTTPVDPETDPPTEDPTTQQTSLPSTTTSPSPDSNDNTVWMITSFVFLLTTVALIAGFIYLIYLYKTALAVKTAMLSTAAIQPMRTTLPRLTVATSSQGNQVIVGIEHIKKA